MIAPASRRQWRKVFCSLEREINSTDSFSRIQFRRKGMKLFPLDQPSGRCNEVLRLPMEFDIYDYFDVDMIGSPSCKTPVESVLSLYEDRPCLQLGALSQFLQAKFVVKEEICPAVMVFLGSVGRDEEGIRYVPAIHLPHPNIPPQPNFMALDEIEGFPGAFQETVLVVMKK